MYLVSLFRFSEYGLSQIYMKYRHDNSTCNWQVAVGLFDALTSLENLLICIPVRITYVLSRENKKGKVYIGRIKWKNPKEYINNYYILQIIIFIYSLFKVYIYICTHIHTHYCYLSFLLFLIIL